MKINAAMSRGGPDILCATVEDSLRINIDGWAYVNFYHMAEIIDAVGGVYCDVTSSELNSEGGLNWNLAEVNNLMGLPASQDAVTNTGYIWLNGRQAVAYARIRKIDSDYKRSERQVEVLRSLMNQFISLSTTGKLSAMEIRYNELPLHTEEMSEALKEQLHQKWVVEKGIELVSFDVNSANTTEENEKLIRDAQAEARYQHAGLGAAALTAAQAQALKDAAKNPNGAANAMFGVGMIGGGMGGGMGNTINALYQQANQEAAAQQQAQAAAAAQAQAANMWKCECGKDNDGSRSLKYLLQPLGFALVALRMTETSVQSAESPVPN